MNKKHEVNFLSEIANFVFTDKYARFNDLMSRRETWNECVSRVEKMHIDRLKRVVTKSDLELISKAFDLVREKKVVPSMRSMQFGGKAVLAHNARIYNCAVRHIDSPRAFAEVFYLLLCGCGVGFGLTKHFINRLPDLVTPADKTGTVVTYVVEDSIEGWADSIEALLNCYFRNTAYSGRKIVFDFSRIRPEGAIIKTGGGKAPGYKGLKRGLQKIKHLLDYIIETHHQTRLEPVNAYDILMHCADAVLSGGIRRSATSVIFDMEDTAMMNAKIAFAVTKYAHFNLIERNGKKYYEGVVYVDGQYGGIKNHKYDVTLEEWEYNILKEKKTISWIHIEPQRARSNNSVLLLRNKVKVDEFVKINEITRQYGDPGFVFADNPYQLYNPCFDRHTRIATDKGICRIGDLYNEDKENNVVVDTRIGKGNKFEEQNFGTTIKTASQVELTQVNAPIYELVTEHGNTLKVTANHEFITPVGRKKLSELQVDDTILLQSGTGQFGDTGTYNDGLLLGLVTGDGTFTSDAAKISIWEDDYDVAPIILQKLHEAVEHITKKTHKTPEQWCLNTQGYSNKQSMSINSNRLFKHIQSFNIVSPRDIKSRVPECIWRGSKEMVVGYLQGLVFTDGSVNLKCASKGNISTLNIEICQSNKELLQDIQVLLNNFGIVSRLYKLHDIQPYTLPDGKGGEKEYLCKASYRLTINRPNAIRFQTEVGLFGRKGQILANLLTERGYDCNKPERYITKVKSITYSHSDDVFCFTQKETNSTIANGLAVGQCFEIAFLPVTTDGVCGVQFCNLSSINGAKIKSLADYKSAVWGATVIGTLQATYTDFKYLSNTAKQLTEAEALLGVSITGVMDNPDILLNAEHQKECALYATQVNEEWAKKLNIRPAARITTIKPEGTSSLVLESASGIHPHHARRYFRRIQVNKHDPVYRFFKKKNPHMCEESVWSANKTDDVITFPITVPDHAIIKADLPAIDHLNIIKSTQCNWVSNGTTKYNVANVTHNVSCTVIVDEHEWNDVFNYMYANRNYFGAVALLSKTGDKMFKQAPNEAVETGDEERWNALVSQYVPVDYKQLEEDEDTTKSMDTVACAGNKCELV